MTHFHKSTGHLSAHQSSYIALLATTIIYSLLLCIKWIVIINYFTPVVKRYFKDWEKQPETMEKTYSYSPLECEVEINHFSEPFYSEYIFSMRF